MSISNYYTGGLAEFVFNPSTLTYSFLKDWFTGKGSLGLAMDKLHLPVEKIDTPLLEFVDEQLVVNLKSEEDTLYKNTVFYYDLERNIHDIPNLKISVAKMLSTRNAINSLKILITQSIWIQNPQKVIEFCKNNVDSIPSKIASANMKEIDSKIKKDVLPQVISIGILNEFYTHVLAQGKNQSEKISINHYIDSTASKSDWFYLSIADQTKVLEGSISFQEYIKKYGLRSDNDYELSSPRWHEIPEIINKRIKETSKSKTTSVNKMPLGKDQKTIDALIQLRLLRSEAKRKALTHFNELRQTILKQTKGVGEISNLTKEDILSGKLTRLNPQKVVKKTYRIQKANYKPIGTGIPVSPGNAIGKVLNINDKTFSVPSNTIGIFPNASPEFTTLFPKCIGIIFKRGGITSHGAIVAREFGIPAIIDPKVGIKNDSEVELNATEGKWNIFN